MGRERMREISQGGMTPQRHAILAQAFFTFQIFAGPLPCVGTASVVAVFGRGSSSTEAASALS